MIEYKFREDELVNELMDYIDSTYEGHYARNKFQATEFIIDADHGKGFMIGNVMKYAQRYGKKGSMDDARKDLMKVLHYALIALYVHDNETAELLKAGRLTPPKLVNRDELVGHGLRELTKR